MKTSILFVIMLFPFLTMAQEAPTIKFFEKYSGEDGYLSVYITKYSFDFFAKINSEEGNQAFQKAVSSLSSIKVMDGASRLSKTDTNIFYTELLPTLSEYEEILMLKEDGQVVKIFTYTNNEKITEFVVLNYGPAENILVIMEGEDINIKLLSKLSETMNIKGIEHIDEIDSK